MYKRQIDEYGLVEREPKTPNSFRTLRVPGIVMEELKKRRYLVERNKLMLGSQYSDRDYISCQENGKLHSMTALNNALTKLCSRNSLPHITVHGLRHMYATVLIEMEVPLVKISALLGHSSVHTTFEYYCDVMDENEHCLLYTSIPGAVKIAKIWLIPKETEKPIDGRTKQGRALKHE